MKGRLDGQRCSIRTRFFLARLVEVVKKSLTHVLCGENPRGSLNGNISGTLRMMMLRLDCIIAIADVLVPRQAVPAVPVVPILSPHVPDTHIRKTHGWLCVSKK